MEKKELYVDISGGQQFVSIGDALAAARQLDAARQSDAASQGAARSAEMEVIIHIAPGIYKERLEIKQDHVSFIGTDAERTKITYSDGALDLMPEGISAGRFGRRASLLMRIIFMQGIFHSAMRQARETRLVRRSRCMRTATI